MQYSKKFFYLVKSIPYDIKQLLVQLVDWIIFVCALLALEYVLEDSAAQYSIFFSSAGLIFILYLCREYEVIFRFYSFNDAFRIAILTFGLSPLVMFATQLPLWTGWFIFSFSSIVCLIFTRLLYANWRNFFLRGEEERKKIMIIGAGEAGTQLLRSIRLSQKREMDPVGFIDDHERKTGMRIDGIPIIGPLTSLQRESTRRGVTSVVIAIPSATAGEMRRILDECARCALEVQTVPSLIEISGDKIDVAKVRSIRAEDLLGRAPIQLDLEGMGRLIVGKTVLVTGAGGSIGEELSRQLDALNPRSLILFEQSEVALYALDRSLQAVPSEVARNLVIGDVRNLAEVRAVFKKYNPDIVFHAAAYKHVPLMEINPLQAIRTNVVGSKNVAMAACEYEVKQFVLISTDKAVNPTNVMGATKRTAELICQDIIVKSKSTAFCAVRFGNVLGSSGSVIPLFKKQIEEGGPVTVTHAEITRYFMSIPEACQLVLQAALLSKGGEIFVLDMGDPVKIMDLANHVIRSAGLIPGRDISIEVTGLRPGEKLFEELLADKEKTIATHHKKISIAMLESTEPDFMERLDALLRIGDKFDAEATELLSALQAVVPEFDHKPNL